MLVQTWLALLFLLVRCILRFEKQWSQLVSLNPSLHSTVMGVNFEREFPCHIPTLGNDKPIELISHMHLVEDQCQERWRS